MKRSWVLADGERRNKKAVPTPVPSNKNKFPKPITEDEKKSIQNYIDKMKLVQEQTEDLNPKASYSKINSVTFKGNVTSMKICN